MLQKNLTPVPVLGGVQICLSARGPFSLEICIIFAHEVSKWTVLPPKMDAQTIIFVGWMRFRTFALGAHFGSFFMSSKIVLKPLVGVTFSKSVILPAAWCILFRGCSRWGFTHFGTFLTLSYRRCCKKKKLMTPLVRECHVLDRHCNYCTNGTYAINVAF